MRYRIGTKALLSVLAVVLLAAVCYRAFGSSGQSEDTHQNSPKKAQNKIDISWKDQPFLCYISGIEGKKALREKKKRYSDVNLLAAVNPLTHEILLVNTPRDTLLSVPGTSEEERPEKLDAMPLHGKKASRKALEELYGVSIDCYIQVNYTVLKGVVDALGGVTVYSETDFESDWGPSFQKGNNVVDGKQALAFVRERHHLTDGDLQRGRNQQYLIQGIVEALKQPSGLPAYPKIFRIVKKGVSTDLSVKSMKNLLTWQMTDKEDWKITNYSITGEPSAGVTDSSDGEEIYVLLPDDDSVQKAARKINKILSHTRGD